MGSVAARVGFFVVVLAVAVIVGVVVASPNGQSAPPVDQLNTSSFDSDESVATVPVENGTLSMSADGSDTVVVVDTAHGASIDPEAVAPMVTTLTDSGATVQYHIGVRRGGSRLNESLRGADAFVVFGSERAYTDRELAGLSAFADAGGRLLLLNEPQESRSGIAALLGLPTSSGTVPSPMGPLTSQYGLAYDSGYLFNMGRYDTNYRNVYATPTTQSTLTEGVDRAVFHESMPVTGGQAELTTTGGTNLSQTRQASEYSVLARSGNVVAVGDTSLFTQEFVYRADNEVLVGNILDFLVSGGKQPATAPEPAGPAVPGGGSVPGGSPPDSPTPGNNTTEPVTPTP